MNDESRPSKPREDLLSSDRLNANPSKPDMSSASRVDASEGASARAVSRVRGKPFFSSVDASLLGIGSQMLSEVAAGVLLGYGLDYLFGTKNRWIVVGSIAGIAVAMLSVFRLALKTQPPRRQAPGGSPGVQNVRRVNGSPSSELHDEVEAQRDGARPTGESRDGTQERST